MVVSAAVPSVTVSSFLVASVLDILELDSSAGGTRPSLRSMRSFGVAPKKRTGPAGKSVGKDGPPDIVSEPAVPVWVLKLALSTRSRDGRRTFARVRPLEPY